MFRGRKSLCHTVIFLRNISWAHLVKYLQQRIRPFLIRREEENVQAIYFALLECDPQGIGEAPTPIVIGWRPDFLNVLSPARFQSAANAIDDRYLREILYVTVLVHCVATEGIKMIASPNCPPDPATRKFHHM
jgi:hypothetical protein